MNNITKNDVAPDLRSARSILFVCFFLSGMTGLMYEVVWVRLFTLVFGNTVYSTAAVLAAFMGGLGLGGRWAGKFIEKKDTAVLWYGVAELVIGAYALVPSVLIHGLEGMYPALYKAAGGPGVTLVLVKLAAAACIIALPAFCMGTTLPLMTRFFTSGGRVFSSSVSTLYGLNTLGAVAGTFLTGFVFLATMGIRSTLQIAMALNIGIGLLAVVQHAKIKAAEGGGGDEAVAEKVSGGADAAAPLPGLHVFIALPCTFLAGFISMLMEVAWTRTLALILGSSVYAFIIILLTFLLGISLGSMAFGRWQSRRGAPGPAALGVCFLGVAFFSAAAFPCLERMVYMFAKTISVVKSDYYIVLLLEFAVSLLIMLPPAMFFGAAFPAAAALFTSGGKANSAGLGRIYFWNTTGAILGSVLTGFAIIPVWGVHAALSGGVVAAVAAGAAILLLSGFSSVKRFGAAAAVSAVAIACVATWKWDPVVMGSGPYIYYSISGRVKSFAGFKSILANNQEMLFYKDGPACTVSVIKSDNSYSLRVNGKTDASTSGDVPTQVFLGAMPMLLHGNPRDVAVIGMGSGMTSGTALLFKSVKHLDIIEIEPAVVKASSFFTKYNFSALKDPRTRVHIDDGRNFMLANEKKYDVIISEPSNHWIAGVASLYSKDYFALAAKRMNPDGIYCQWLQFYAMSPASLSMILNTFQSVFPETQLYMIGSDLFLLGSRSPIKTDARAIRERFIRANIIDKISSLGAKFTPLGIAPAHYVAGPAEVRRLSSLGGMNSDDHPYLEFAAPFEFFSDNTPIFNMIQNVYPVDPLERTGLDAAALTPEEYLEISEDMSTSRARPVKLDEYLEKASAGKGDTAREAFEIIASRREAAGKFLAADDAYRAAIAAGGDDKLKLKYAKFLNRQGRYAEAAAGLEKMSPSARKELPYFETKAMSASGLGRHMEEYSLLMKIASMSKGADKQAAMYYNAAKALEKAGPGNKPGVSALLAEANKLQPLQPLIARDYAEILYNENKPSDALAVLAKPFARDSGVTEVNLLIMEIRRSLENKR